MKKVLLILATSLCVSLTLNAQTISSPTPVSVELGTDLTVSVTYTSPVPAIVQVAIARYDSEEVYIDDVAYKEMAVSISLTDLSVDMTVAIPSTFPNSASLASGENYKLKFTLVDRGHSYLAGGEVAVITLTGTTTDISSENIPEYGKIGDELSVEYTYTNPNAGRVAIGIQLQELNSDGDDYVYVAQVVYVDDNDMVSSAETSTEGKKTFTIPATFNHDDDTSTPVIAVPTTTNLQTGQRYVLVVQLLTEVGLGYNILDSSLKEIKLTDVDIPTVALFEDTGSDDSDGNTRNAQITVGNIGAGATWEYKVEGQNSFTTGGVDFTIPASAFGSDGEKTVVVKHINTEDSYAGKSFTFTLDTTAPIITVTERFIILGQNSLAPILLEGVSIDDISSITATGAVTVATIGEYIINYDATDLAGNVATQVSRTYRVVDSSSLIVVIQSETVATDGITSSSTISYTAIFSKSVSDFAAEDITVDGTANSNSPEVSSFAGSGKTYTFDVTRGSSDGTVIVSILGGKATDITGGSTVPTPPITNTASNTYTVTIDTELPGIPTLSLTEDTGIRIDTITSDARITVGNIETGATWKYKIEGEDSFTTGTGSVIPANAFGQDGDVTVIVKQRDVAGNYSPEASFSFTLDTTAPSVPIITTQITISLSTPFEFEGTTDTETKVKLFRVDVLLDSTTVTGTDTDWTINIDLTEGENLITAQATDVAGNISELSDVFTISLSMDAIVWRGSSWTGGSGTNNAPSSDETKDLIIDSETPAILSTNVEVNSLWVMRGKLIVQDGKYLKVANNLRLDGELRLIGTSQLVQTHEGASMMNMASTSNMYKDQEGVATTTYQYNYWSSPVREVNSATFSIAGVMKNGTIPTSQDSTPQEITFVDTPNGNTDNSIVSISNNWIYSYINGLFPNTTPSSGWVKKTQTGSFNPGEGFTLKGPGRLQNYTFKGIPNDGDITTTITGYSDNSNSKYFSLLGNPYPSALDGVKFLEHNITTIDGLYFWDQKANLDSHTHSAYTGGYATINIAMGVSAPTLTAANQSSEYKVPTKYIPVGQGFFVRGTQAGGTITFKNAQRIFKPRGAQSFLFKRRNKQTSTLPILRIGFDYIDDDGLALHRQLGISFKEGNTFGKEAGYDTGLFVLNDTDAYFQFDGSDEKLVIAGIQQITDNLKFPITIRLSNANPISLMIDNFKNIDRPIFLIDKVTNQRYDLTLGSAELNIPIGTYTDRFYISFSSNLSTEKSILETINLFFDKNTREIVFVNQQNTIHLESVELFNVLGKKVLQWNTSKQTNVFKVTGLANGMYIVRIKTDKGTLSKKVIIN